MGGLIAGIAVSTIASAISGYMGAKAQKEAYELMGKASAEERQMLQAAYDQAYGNGSYNQKMQELGAQATNDYMRMINDRDAWDRYVEGERSYVPQDEFSFTAEDLYSDPSYKFRQEQGLAALDQSNVAQGLNLSSRAMKDAMDYNSGLASQEYQNAYSRAFNAYKDNRDFDYNAWKDQANQYYENLKTQLSGLGNVAGMGMQASNNQTEALMGLAGQQAKADWAGATANANAGMAGVSQGTSILDALGKGVSQFTGLMASQAKQTPSESTPTNTTPIANPDFSELFLNGYNPALATTNNLIGA